MSLATALMAVGLPAEAANRIGYSDRVPLDGRGTTQIGAAEILRDNTNIALGTSAGNTAFILPAEAEYFQPYFLLNSTEHPALIFPPVGDSIDAHAVNAEVAIATDLFLTVMRVEEGRWVAAGSASSIGVAGGYVNVVWFGARGNGVTDDSAAINAAALFTAIQGGTLYCPKTSNDYYIGSTTVQIPAGVNLVMDAGASLQYDGDGIALHIDAGNTVTPARFGHYDVSVYRTAVEWTSGADTSSVGVRLTNIREAQVNVRRVQGFNTGLQPCGDATGTVNNTFNLGLIRNCRFGIAPLLVNGGWANQNTYVGGSIPIDSDKVNLPGLPTRLIDTGLTDGNTFLGVNLEGFAELPSYCVVNSGSFNSFVNCRFEEQGEGTFLIPDDPAGVGTTIISGYGNYSPEGSVVDDAGSRAAIMGAWGSRFIGAPSPAGTAAVIAHARSASTAIALQVEDYLSNVFFEVEGDGNIRLYDAGGKGVVSFPSMIINATNSSIDMGDVAGNAAPVPVFRANNTQLNYLNKYHKMAATGTRGVEWVPLANLATSITLTGGTGYLTQGTTPLSGLGAGIDGQEFFIKAGASGATITNGASFKTKSGSNLTLAAGQVAKFVAVSSSVAWEI